MQVRSRSLLQIGRLIKRIWHRRQLVSQRFTEETDMVKRSQLVVGYRSVIMFPVHLVNREPVN
jgi:predicted nuclease of restriction endonuclease-like (RecB) superfamily